MSGRNTGPIELMEAVDQIYAAALDSARLPDALRALNRCIRGAMVQADVREFDSARLVSSQVSAVPALAGVHAAYLQTWAERDPRIALLMQSPPGAVIECEARLGGVFVAEDPFYRDFFFRSGVGWSTAGMYGNDDGTVTVVIGARALSDGPYDESAIAAFAQLLPHMQRASVLRAKLRHVQPASPLTATRLFSVLPVPLLLTDAAGRCVELNEAFDEAAQSLSLRPVLGRLRFENADLQARWDAALTETHATAVSRSVAMTGLGRHWRVHLIPLATVLPGSGAEGHMILAVFEERQAGAAAPVADFAVRGRFTRAELEVLAGLMQGLSAKSIASQRGASINTVRSQIMSILEKSGHNSQRELIAAFSASSFQDSRAQESRP